MSKYGVFSGPYFPVFGPEKKTVFGHFSRSDECQYFCLLKGSPNYIAFIGRIDLSITWNFTKDKIPIIILC